MVSSTADRLGRPTTSSSSTDGMGRPTTSSTTDGLGRSTILVGSNGKLVDQQTNNNEGMGAKIINLSSIDLSQEEIETLKYGFKFTPTPTQNETELKADTKAFCRKLRLAEYFLDKDYTTDESLVKNKSSFNPPRGRDKYLDTYIDYTMNLPLHQTHAKRYNMSWTQKRSVNKLKNLTDVIFKEADKGGAIVIMDKDYYGKKMLEMLQDKDTYKELPSNADKDTFKKISFCINKHKDVLTEKEKDYLLEFSSKTSNFYGLPKVHKCSFIIDQVKKQNSEYIKLLAPEDLKFRPIVAGPSCPTHRLSNLIDILLKPLLKHVKSYVRDDIDFLTKLPKNISKDEEFITFDVTNLYSNISHELGIKAISHWIDKHYSSIDKRFSKEFIIDSIKIILENNTFNLGDRTFLQIKGTAMGTKMAPTYATLVLAYLEEMLYNKINQKFGKEYGIHFEKQWKRYLDDCFYIHNSNKCKIETIHQMLNDLDKNLYFTIERSKSEIPFLDILVKNVSGNIVTDMYHKPTDTKQYLHFKSCHPRAMKMNIPYSLARRVCTIVSDTNLRTLRLQQLSHNLQARHYPKSVIIQGIEKAQKLDIETLRTPKETTPQTLDTIAFVSTHNPNNANIFQTTKDSLKILENSQKGKLLLQNLKLINSKRQAPNLKKILTKAKFSDSFTGVHKCNKTRCKTCQHIIEGQGFTFRPTGKTFYVKCQMDCTTENILYVIECQGCKEHYIGQTSNSLQKRTTLHRQHFDHPEYRKLPVSSHIPICAKDKDIKFKIFPFYKFYNENKEFRDTKEKYFQQKFKTTLNT